GDDERGTSHRGVHVRRVDDRAAFRDAACGTQRDGGGIAVVSDGRGDGARGGERFEVATRRAADGDGQRVVGLHIGIVGTHEERSAVGTALANRNRDDLAVGQRDDERGSRDGTVDSRRVLHDALPIYAACGAQRDGGGIAVVSDRRRGGARRGQRFEVAT